MNISVNVNLPGDTAPLTKRQVVMLSADQDSRLRSYCAERGIEISVFLRHLIKQVLAKAEEAA